MVSKATVVYCELLDEIQKLTELNDNYEICALCEYMREG